MELVELGMNRWFTDLADELCEPEQRIARVTVVDRGWYIIRNEHGDVPAQATGKFMHTNKSAIDRPCVGDWVCVDHHDSEDFASIHRILPRKSFLRRKSAGKSTKLQMIAANIDVAFIVQSCLYDFNVSRLERYLVMAEAGQVEPLVILTKTDLVSVAELEQLILEIRAVGIHTRIIALSNVSGDGLDQIEEVMGFGKTYCLLGSSGVGKTTLINRLTGHDTLRTRTVSQSGEGRHTTVRRQMFVLEQGAMLIDTPGMREVGVLGADEGMDDNFDDILELSAACRFNNCGHTNEPGCKVLKAVKRGKLPQEHHQNYLKLKAESVVDEMSYAEKRKKGKVFRSVVRPEIKHKE